MTRIESEGAEFSMLSDMALELGSPTPVIPPVRRVEVVHEGQRVSGLQWGNNAPQVVFLHGGSQNAHTWDAVALQLGVSALALDLPGHGHSSWRSDHDYSASKNAPAVAAAIERFAPAARLVVGMSLGGMTLLALADRRPELVKRAVLVDILPPLSVNESHPDKERIMKLRQDSHRRFRTRDAMVNQVVSVARRRPTPALERGVIHNSVQDPDGWWRWRYDPARVSAEQHPQGNNTLWRAVAALPSGSKLLKAELSTFVGPEALQTLGRVAPDVTVETVAAAGHSIQGDQPNALAYSLLKALDPSADSSQVLPDTHTSERE